MGAVVSALVYTLLDEAKNPRTEGWFIFEFGENYPEGGIGLDLSPYFRRIERVIPSPVSGGVLRALLSGGTPASGAYWGSGDMVRIVPVVQDYTTPVSTRFQVWAHVVLSSFGVREIVSAPAAVVSGLRFGAQVLGY